MADEIDVAERLLVARSASIVAALHFEATRIAQARVGPLDPAEIGSLAAALATVFAALLIRRS